MRILDFLMCWTFFFSATLKAALPWLHPSDWPYDHWDYRHIHPWSCSLWPNDSLWMSPPGYLNWTSHCWNLIWAGNTADRTLLRCGLMSQRQASHHLLVSLIEASQSPDHCRARGMIRWKTSCDSPTSKWTNTQVLEELIPFLHYLWTA